MTERIGQISSQLDKRKKKKMAQKTTLGNPEENEKGNGMNFEFIDESEIESVKRGRKPVVIAEMVAFMEKAKVGQTAKLSNLAIDSALDAESKQKMKAANSAIIRAQAKLANWNKVSIKWDTKGIPYAKREA